MTKLSLSHPDIISVLIPCAIAFAGGYTVYIFCLLILAKEHTSRYPAWMHTFLCACDTLGGIFWMQLLDPHLHCRRNHGHLLRGVQLGLSATSTEEAHCGGRQETVAVGPLRLPNAACGQHCSQTPERDAPPSIEGRPVLHAAQTLSRLVVATRALVTEQSKQHSECAGAGHEEQRLQRRGFLLRIRTRRAEPQLQCKWVVHYRVMHLICVVVHKALAT
jgi:hypothetical protein